MQRDDHAPEPPGAGEAASVLDVRTSDEAVRDARVSFAEDGDRGRLPVLLANVPVAILLIDVHQMQVTYANDVAAAMTNGGSSGLSLEEWGSAAGVLAGDGSAAPDLLSGVVRRAGSHGVVVRVGGRSLVATGFPLSGAENLTTLALLVLLETADGRSPEGELARLRESALYATELAFTITDPAQPDNPLIWVNPAFTAITGFSSEESVGRNCRFLQGTQTDPHEVQVLRDAIASATSFNGVLQNYRKDGTPFWNHLSVSPVFDADLAVVSFVGVQADVTQRVEADRDLRAAHDAERSARADAEAAWLQQRLLAEATQLLSETLDVDAALARLLQLVLPQLADWAVIMLQDEHGRRVAAARHRDGLQDVLARYTTALTAEVGDGGSAQVEVLGTGRPVLIPSFTPDYAAERGISSAVMEASEELGMTSALVVPLAARGRRLGSLALISGSSGRSFTSEDLGVAMDLARRAGLAIDNARLYQREHETAETLQRSLLPDLPDVDGITVSALYVAGDVAASVGGDFYEVLDLPDGGIGLAIGDVVGHDMRAAAQMGHLRGLLRACAWESSASEGGAPATVLARVDRMVQGLAVAPLATLLYGRLERPGDGLQSWSWTSANAGHPPALLRHPDGAVEVLDGQGVLLGVVPDSVRENTTRALSQGSTLVLYTDGLVERRDEDIEASIEALRALVEGQPVGATPAELCAAVVGRNGAERQDDVAVLAVRLDRPARST